MEVFYGQTHQYFDKFLFVIIYQKSKVLITKLLINKLILNVDVTLFFFGNGLIGCKLRSFFFNGLNFHAMENQNQIKSNQNGNIL